MTSVLTTFAVFFCLTGLSSHIKDIMFPHIPAAALNKENAFYLLA